jgi:two-component system, response regulator / RNA-binding antiterminator
MNGEKSPVTGHDPVDLDDALAALDRCRTELMNLKRAGDIRATIDQAIGILLARHGGTPEEAFAILNRASQRSHTKVRDIAAQIVAGASKDRQPAEP